MAAERESPVLPCAAVWSAASRITGVVGRLATVGPLPRGSALKACGHGALAAGSSLAQMLLTKRQHEKRRQARCGAASRVRCDLLERRRQ
jgi:hypothetical protein